MIRKKLWYTLQLALMLQFLQTQNIHAGWQEFSKGCLITGGVLAGIGSIVSLCNWVSSESDYQLYEHAHDYYHKHLNQYTKVLRTIPHEQAQGFSEHELSIMWRTAQKNNEADLLLQELDAHVSKLKDYAHDLGKRRKKTSQYDEGKHLAHLMQELEHSIVVFVGRLEHVQDICRTHRSFFQLIQTTDIMQERYKKPLYIIKHDYTARNKTQKIKRYVLRDYADSQRYPFVHTVEQLNNDIASLERLIQNVHYTKYYKTMRKAERVLKDMTTIKHILLELPEYFKEVRTQERVRLEQERQKLEKKQQELEREKLRILKERNRLKKKELALLQEYDEWEDPEFQDRITHNDIHIHF